MTDPAVLPRVAFAAAWIVLQIGLIASADSRPDAAFGFRMFAESSTIEAHLSRETASRGTVRVEGGQWTTREPSGRVRVSSWHDRIKDPLLSSFDRTFAASYSAGAQVARWHAALDDVATHLESDGDTRALDLDLTVRRNGHEPVVTHFTAPIPGSVAQTGGR